MQLVELIQNITFVFSQIGAWLPKTRFTLRDLEFFGTV